jgi:hypothetical protein
MAEIYMFPVPGESDEESNERLAQLCRDAGMPYARSYSRDDIKKALDEQGIEWTESPG